MAKFLVLLQPEAERNITEIFAWLSERSSQGAASWYQAFEQAIERLRDGADRFPVAPESREFELELRDVLFKTRSGRPYRLIFTMNGTDVHVLYVRGAGQDWVRP